MASFLRSNCRSVPDIYYLFNPPPPSPPVWGIDMQNTFKFTNETQSTASGVLDKIIEKKRPFF